MKQIRLFLCATLGIIALVAVVFSGAAPLQAHSQEANEACVPQTLACPVQTTDTLAPQLSGFKAPSLAAPEPPRPTNSSRVVTYDVTTRGNVTADFATFKTLANQTLNDGRGWSRMGVQFTEVASGGQFTLVLAAAAELPNFSSGCDSQYSCAVGRYVIINQDRWQGATSSWNQAGGSLRDYRHMVVNHETGHWLGHGHQSCPGPGQPAPVMQQQSINLQGCSFNPWPVASELWSTRLGIT